MLRRLPLVGGTILLEAIVLGRLVLLTTSLTTLLALDVGVRAVRAAEAVLGRYSLVWGSVLLEPIVLCDVSKESPR